jgi:hypothetical protein
MSAGQSSSVTNTKDPLNRFPATGSISMADIRSKYFPGSTAAISINYLYTKVYYTTSGTGKDVTVNSYIIDAGFIIEGNPTSFNLNTLRGKFYSYPITSLTNTYAYDNYSTQTTITAPPSGPTPVSVRIIAVGGGGGGGAGGIGKINDNGCDEFTAWGAGGGGGGGGTGGTVDIQLTYNSKIKNIIFSIGVGGDGLSYGGTPWYGGSTLVAITNSSNIYTYQLLAAGGDGGNNGGNAFCQYSGAGGAGGINDTNYSYSYDYSSTPHSENPFAGEIVYNTAYNGNAGLGGASGSDSSTGGTKGTGTNIPNFYAGGGGDGAAGAPAYGGFPAKASNGKPGCVIIIWYYV